MLYFHNPGQFDLTALHLISVSVKETDSPIGQFGTGLKYAIAILLRHGASITISTGGRDHVLGQTAGEYRGQPHSRITLDGEPLPFTTAYGKDWPLWTAYRELLSNAIDESGGVSSTPVRADTVIAVDLPALDAVHQSADTIFLQSKPIWAEGSLEIHQGQSQYIFANGIRVYELPKGSYKYTYNMTGQVKLSEDRTLADHYNFRALLNQKVSQLTDKQILQSLAIADPDFPDTQTEPISWLGCSSEFLETVAANKNNGRLNQAWKKRWKEETKQAEVYDYAEIEPWQARMIEEACTFLRPLRANPADYPIHVVSNLGAGIIAMADQKEKLILLSDRAFDNGPQHLAATLFEEWCHLEHNYYDETREFQQYLIDRLMAITARLT